MKQVFGFAYYFREQWEILKKNADDPNEMDDTYESWQEGARKSIAALQENGIDLRRVDINVFELIQWCRKHKKKLNASARSEFCGRKLMEMDKQD